MTDLEREIARLDAVVEPIAKSPASGESPTVDAETMARAEKALRTLLARYAGGDEATRVAIRGLFDRYPSFRWAAHIPREPTVENFRLQVLHLSAKNHGADTRDEMMALDHDCTKASEAGIDVVPILREVAEISSDVDRYGMGSIRGILLRWARQS